MHDEFYFHLVLIWANNTVVGDLLRRTRKAGPVASGDIRRYWLY